MCVCFYSSSNSLGGQRNKLIKLVIWTGFTHRIRLTSVMMSSHQLQTKPSEWERVWKQTRINILRRMSDTVLTFTHRIDEHNTFACRWISVVCIAIRMRKPNQRTEFRRELSFIRFFWCYSKWEPFTQLSIAQANVYINCRFARLMNESCLISLW